MSQVIGYKRGETVAETKPDAITGSMHHYPVDIFATGQTVAMQIAHELLVVTLILPDTHRRTAPEVARAILDDSAHHFVAEHLRPLIGYGFLLLGVVEIETRDGAYQEVVVTRLTHRLHSIVIEQHIPAVRMEMVFHRVVAVDA